MFKTLIERSVGLDPFHINQYGFRKKKNTANAMCLVDDLAEACKRKKMIYVIAAIDIKNAFNTSSWNKILKDAEERECPKNPDTS